MTEVEEKTEKSAKSKKQETGNRDSTAGPHIGRAANALKAQGMYRTNGQANPGKNHTSQYKAFSCQKESSASLTGAAVVASKALGTVQAALP